MSLVSLARIGVSRRSDFEPAERGLESYHEIAVAASEAKPAAMQPAGGTSPVPAPVPSGRSSGVGDVVQAILSYIPTEVILIYLTFLNAITGLKVTTSGVAPSTQQSVVPPAVPATSTSHVLLQPHGLLFLIMLATTPLAVWLVFAGTLRRSDRPLPLGFRTWPLWEMFAGTVAFAAWALAISASIPGANLGVPPHLASPIVLVTTIVIGLAGGVFAPRLPAN